MAVSTLLLVRRAKEGDATAKQELIERFSEVDLRSMMSAAINLREDHEPGRWVVETSHESRLWEVIVELDSADQLLVVITAYPVESI